MLCSPSTFYVSRSQISNGITKIGLHLNFLFVPSSNSLSFLILCLPCNSLFVAGTPTYLFVTVNYLSVTVNVFFPYDSMYLVYLVINYLCI